MTVTNKSLNNNTYYLTYQNKDEIDVDMLI